MQKIEKNNKKNEHKSVILLDISI